MKYVKLYISIAIMGLVLYHAVYPQGASAEQLQAGFVLLKSERFSDAAAHFGTMLKSEPDSFQARLGLAISLIGTDRFAEASREIAKLLAREPKDSKLLEMAAQSFLRQKRFAEAEIVLKRRLDLGEAPGLFWAMFGDTLDAQKRSLEAVRAYEMAVGLTPDSIEYRYALGSVYWKLFRYDDAEREFLEVLKRQPNEPRASFNLGDIYLSNGYGAKAVGYLEVSVRAFPDEFDVRFSYGRALLLTKNFSNAVDQLEAATKLRPEIAEGFYQLGLALQKSGQQPRAKVAFDRARELQNAKRAVEAVPLKSRPQ